MNEAVQSVTLQAGTAGTEAPVKQRRAFPEHVPFYAMILPVLVRVAREHGYALGLHGSMATDCDLIAVPWTEQATDALTLVRALKAATGTNTHGFEFDRYSPDLMPTAKPHGRVAYPLHFTNKGGNGPYLDVSVMPRTPTPLS